MVYCRSMDAHKCSWVPISFLAWLTLLVLVSAGCPSKTIQYPEEHARLLNLDQALESFSSGQITVEEFYRLTDIENRSYDLWYFAIHRPN